MSDFKLKHLAIIVFLAIIIDVFFGAPKTSSTSMTLATLGAFIVLFGFPALAGLNKPYNEKIFILVVLVGAFSFIGFCLLAHDEFMELTKHASACSGKRIYACRFINSVYETHGAATIAMLYSVAAFLVFISCTIFIIVRKQA